MVGEEDTMKCQNHKLKKIYEEVESNCQIYKNDFTVITEVVTFIAANGNIRRELSSYQRINDLADLALFLFNETRWESRFKVVKRFVELKKSIVEIFTNKQLLSKWRETVEDFLEDQFFQRIAEYLTFLEEMNRVSLFYQTQRFPTGCFVPLLILHLMKISKPNFQMDAPYLHNFKSTLHSAVKKYMFEPILKNKNNFLKASLLHPGVAAIICKHVSQELLEQSFNSIADDALLMEDNDSQNESSYSFIASSISCYRQTFIPNGGSELPNILPWKTLNATGSINGYSHLEFWQEVAVSGIKFRNGKYSHLLKAASMLLAQPSGESIDESTFSSVGNTMRKDRSNLSPMKIEQITVIRMFIRNFKWDPHKLHQWFEEQLNKNNN